MQFTDTYDLPLNMPMEQFRQVLISRLDAALSHTWVIVGNDRAMLQAFRSYVPSMSSIELQKIFDLLPVA